MTPGLTAFSVLVFTLMLLETWLSRRNERRLRQRGALEPRDDVYWLMLLAYPGSFLVMVIEGLCGTWPPSPVAGMALFTCAKALKYWAIGSLGPRWCFRVLVPPGDSAVVAGPYRWIRHPNYVAVTLELVAAALVCGAWITGPLAVATFCLLMWRRIAVEERALGLR